MIYTWCRLAPVVRLRRLNMKHKIKGRNYKITTPRVYGKKETRTTQFIRKQLINNNGAICSLCNKPIETMKDCTIDHIIPVSKGGLTTIENCQLAHRNCNSSKGNKEDYGQLTSG
ncbi:MAG: HNH endonuclease [Prevotella pallens]|nr:HNH endonuclease [Prevotella pallens]